MSNKSVHDSDVAFIRAMATLLNENELSEIEVTRHFAENDSLNIRVSRQREVVTQVSHASPGPTYVQAPPLAMPVSASTSDPALLPGAVTSPMVGTVYLQAEPGTPPFVAIGQQVREGETLLIIEAMKTMNQIPAPRSGIVKRIVVEDGAPVEYGAPLMIIE